MSEDLRGQGQDPAGEADRAGRAGLLARVALDIRPLRASKPFRRLWLGTGISAIGSQITTVAIPFQVYELTPSTLLVGLLGLGLGPVRGRGGRDGCRIFLVDTNAMIFGMPSALFPAFAEEVGGGPQTVGLLYSAPAAGAFAVTLVSGCMGQVRREGLGVYRGSSSRRWRAPPSLGNVEAGTLAALTNVRFSVASGGVACVVGTVAIALALPALLRYDAKNPHA